MGEPHVGWEVSQILPSDGWLQWSLCPTCIQRESVLNSLQYKTLGMVKLIPLDSWLLRNKHDISRGSFSWGCDFYKPMGYSLILGRGQSRAGGLKASGGQRQMLGWLGGCESSCTHLSTPHIRIHWCNSISHIHDKCLDVRSACTPVYCAVLMAWERPWPCRASNEWMASRW